MKAIRTTPLPSHPTHRRRGFTLIELLATLMLIGIILPAVATGITLSLTTATVARQRSEAASLAHTKLMELVAESQLQDTQLSGDFGTDQPDYSWTADVADGDLSTLKQVDVTVTWRFHGTNRSVKVSTLAYVPEEESS